MLELGFGAWRARAVREDDGEGEERAMVVPEEEGDRWSLEQRGFW